MACSPSQALLRSIVWAVLLPATTATARVFSYNPATDTATTLTGDDWPGAMGTILPGGFAVANNKLYILGGFNVNVASTNQIWSFDPTAGVGSKWTLAPVTTPEGIMYAPTAAINGIIYVGRCIGFPGWPGDRHH